MLMNISSPVFSYWGKAQKCSDGHHKFHLLVYHCLDVVAVADVWLKHSNILLNQFSQHVNQPPEKARKIVLFFVLLHDFGKFDCRFQGFIESIRIQLQGDEFEVEPERYSHGSFGYHYFRQLYGNNEAMKAVAGHHGCCDLLMNFDEPDADEELIELDIQARQVWIKCCLDWLGLENIPNVGEIPMLAGLCSVSDWIGSSITPFYTEPTLTLDEYYVQIKPEAEKALLATGMINELEGSGFEFLFPSYEPRGIQTLLPTMPITAGLTIVESDTGSGKTEFALSYASELIAQNLADGVVFGLPTQATANGLYDRIGEAAEKLFPDSIVTLAHGKSRYVTEQLVPDENGFLYRSNKRAFLGSMSVATVDQILMGVLGIKHQFIRSFGTRKSVLILDEIHSFDAYMYALIEQVLKGQHQAFASVILLSATLPTVLKEKLLAPYAGCSKSDDYPLITHSGLDGITTEFSLAEKTEKVVSKTIHSQLWQSSNLMPEPGQQEELLEWARQGAMVGIICNTVNDAQMLYHELCVKSNDVDIDLFHARYVFGDRSKIEKQVLATYGKEALRTGRILVATQVVEQSLDLDFDLLVSQIAPIEFLMQRMGRLWRHDRESGDLAPRSNIFNKPTFITIVPSIEASDWQIHYRDTGFVYSNIRTLYRTHHYLNKVDFLTFPDCYRDAIEFVHRHDSYDFEPKQLTQIYETYMAQQEGSHYAAKMYSTLDSKPLNDVDPRCALLTREGEMSATVVVFKQNGELWYGGDYSEQHDRENSSVALNKKHAKGVKDEEFHCIRSVVDKDIIYNELGVVLDPKK
ncbi:putative CRISPR-associated protein [Vibrio halioticoli NBRC 102217]|uniref:Putative CRISPR-associated protein n=1 Tax=Vibrio halioticoli NBRC 102217 TaxID=1219072 RepID=V5FE97_9VIBR|nr:CRISPR-associated helicase/endonuclease Cas3 [Vibrio halioticoli]GAD89983.1 putative CRISPR-associated protein [Vibrio halioticoli NBRC 102217]